MQNAKLGKKQNIWNILKNRTFWKETLTVLVWILNKYWKNIEMLVYHQIQIMIYLSIYILVSSSWSPFVPSTPVSSTPSPLLSLTIFSTWPNCLLEDNLLRKLQLTFSFSFTNTAFFSSSDWLEVVRFRVSGIKLLLF